MIQYSSDPASSVAVLADDSSLPLLPRRRLDVLVLAVLLIVLRAQEGGA